jgi:hypothetical protein
MSKDEAGRQKDIDKKLNRTLEVTSMVQNVNNNQTTEAKNTVLPGTRGSRLSSLLLRKQRSRGSWFQVTLGEKKTLSQIKCLVKICCPQATPEKMSAHTADSNSEAQNYLCNQPDPGSHTTLLLGPGHTWVGYCFTSN